MVIKMKRIAIITMLLLVFGSTDSLCRDRASLQLGVSVITDASHNYWSPGVGVYLDALHYSAPNIAYGFHFGLSSNGESESVERQYISSRLFSLEIMPALRIQTNRQSMIPFDFYFQTAIGLTIVDGGYAYNPPMPPPPACVDCTTVSDGSENLITAGAFGMNIGFGLVSNNAGMFRYDMTLLYHIGFSEPERNEFVSLTLGVMLGV